MYFKNILLIKLIESAAMDREEQFQLINQGNLN